MEAEVAFVVEEAIIDGKQSICMHKNKEGLFLCVHLPMLQVCTCCGLFLDLNVDALSVFCSGT